MPEGPRGQPTFHECHRETKEEMAWHCRRRTRGVEATTKAIEELV